MYRYETILYADLGRTGSNEGPPEIVSQRMPCFGESFWYRVTKGVLHGREVRLDKQRHVGKRRLRLLLIHRGE
jgi:hypothetical protein